MKELRKLNSMEYLDVLQKEYIVAEFRSKIYISDKDKVYYSRLMDGKKEKIEKISLINQTANIFNSDPERNKYYGEFYTGNSIPLFEGMTTKDFKFYYFKNNSVLYDDNGTLKQGKIINGYLQNNSIIIEVDSVEKRVQIHKVRRIL